MNQSHKIRSFGLNKEAKWAIFVLNKFSRFEALGGTSLPKLPLNASKGDQSLNISAIKPK